MEKIKVKKELLNRQFQQIFEKIEELQQQKEHLIIAIEGGSASGKTTLGEILKQRYECNVFHMDDFFLRLEQRTKERLEEPGGNVDRERFLKEVLLPLTKNEMISYKRFDCGTCQILPAVDVYPKKLNVVEGAYSMHPLLEKYYDFSIFLEIESELQKKRIHERNTPEKAKRFFQEWIPMEKNYQEKMKIKERCEMIIRIQE